MLIHRLKSIQYFLKTDSIFELTSNLNLMDSIFNSELLPAVIVGNSYFFCGDLVFFLCFI